MNWGSKSIVKMSQDIVSDALNGIMNSKRVGKLNVEITRISKFLLNIFEMMKAKGHIDFEVKDDGDGKPKAIVKILKLNECRAIKPRYFVRKDEVDRYLRRFLPSRNFGTLVISTSKGLLSHQEADEAKLGGAVIAYFY